MGIVSEAGNVVVAVQYYKNWPEVILAIVKRQEPAKVILKDGLRIEASEHLRFLVREVYIEKPYNPVNLPVEENDIVVDIGANNGVFTVLAASRTRNTVYAFEPAPRAFEFLGRNIRANGLSNVIAYNSAVSDKIGSTKLLLHPGGSAGNVLFDPIIPNKLERHLQLGEDPTAFFRIRKIKPVVTPSGLLPVDSHNAETSPSKLGKYVEVPTTTLQDIMDSNNLEQIDFLKIDCEGSEGSILRVTPREYLKRVRKIAMEFHDGLSQLDHNDIQKLLEEVGFTTKLKWNHKSPFGYLYGWRSC